MSPGDPSASMASLQESDYGDGRDYAYGSPHLTHDRLRLTIEDQLTTLVRSVREATGQCRVLEVGAGHGSFTQVLVDAGAVVTVTEMSAPSAALLTRKFADEEGVSVVHDPEADQGEALVAAGCDLVVFVSVLHHIPDYLAVVEGLVRGLPPGGGFYCAQDPMFYPGLRRGVRVADRLAYFGWRIGQGEVRRGVATRWRRLRGVYDESRPSDMVEYHVVRQGVDERALVQMLERYFERCELWTYWSTPSAVLQRLGDRLGLDVTFGITATGRRSA